MTEEYRRKEQEFMDRHDSLCEDTPPQLCDCSVCPTRDLCKWLHEYHPFPINKPFSYCGAATINVPKS